MKEAEKKANDKDNKDIENKSNNNDNKTEDNENNKNDDNYDVPAYKGRIVKNQEYGMNDMELEIQRMRKPNSDLSWYRT